MALTPVLGRTLAGLPASRSGSASGEKPLGELAVGRQTRDIALAPFAQSPGAHLAIRRKASAEQGATAAECRVEVEDRGRDHIEQPPIMRHEHGDPSELEHPLDKALQRVVIEVVARLIE